jgi:carbon storage regulator CsrA
MLTLRRKLGERIVVIPPDSGPVVVTVVDIDPRSGRVWLGFEADAETTILREEVRKRMLAEHHPPTAK